MWRILIRTRGILAAMQSHQRLIIPVAAAIVFIVAGLSLVWGFRGTMAAAPPSSVARAPTVEQVSNEILETAKGLGITQQQAVDQLQVVQDQLIAQQTETKKLSEQITTLTERLDALQQSLANLPAASTHAAATGLQAKPR
jgi:septal ring factor EnvC (AmiA/AmiB activator)